MTYSNWLVNITLGLTVLAGTLLFACNQSKKKIYMETIKLFPVKDSEPKYYPNPPQIWDVKITAQSQEWKL